MVAVVVLVLLVVVVVDVPRRGSSSEPSWAGAWVTPATTSTAMTTAHTPLRVVSRAIRRG